MATTPIILSTGSTSGAGTAGEGRNDLVISETVTLTDTEPSNSGATYLWTLLEIPEGSTATLTGPTTSSPTFSPDVTGSYWIQALVNGVFRSTEIIAVPLPNTLARIPAFNEQLEYDAGGNTKGWHESLTAFMRGADGIAGAANLDAAYDGGGSGAGRTIAADAGAVELQTDGLTGGFVGTHNLRLFNATAATAGVQQNSPSVRLEGQGWNGASSESVYFDVGTVPSAGTGGEAGTFNIVPKGTTGLIRFSTAGGMELTDAGTFTVEDPPFYSMLSAFPGARGGLSSGEKFVVNLQGGGITHTFTGSPAMARQGFWRVSAVDYDAASAGATITDASTLIIDSTPAAGSANMTITNSWALRAFGPNYLEDGVVMLERADHAITPAATFGQLWVRNDAPNVLVYTDDAGTDHDLVGGAAGGNTLDQAYDQGGVGAGRTVTVDSGSVALNEGADSTPAGIFHVTGAAHVARPIAEYNDVLVNLAQTKQFTTGGGTITDQRAVYVQAPTYAADTDALTLTNASTVTISGAPVAGTNVTITTPAALNLESGSLRLGNAQLVILDDDADTAIRASADDQFDILIAGNVRYRLNPASGHTLSQEVNTSGTPKLFETTGAAHTGMAIAEMIDLDFDLARTATFTTGGGTIPNQRASLFRRPTYAADTDALTLTTASTVAIDNAPLAGANVTITRPTALTVEAGLTYLNDGLEMLERADHVATPIAGRGGLWVRNDAPNVLVFTDDAGTDWVLNAAVGGNTLDQAYDQGGAGAGRAVSVTDGAVTFTNNAANNNNVFEITKSPGAAQSGSGQTITMGANASAPALFISESGTSVNAFGIDIQMGSGAGADAIRVLAHEAGDGLFITSTGAFDNHLINLSKNPVSQAGNGINLDMGSGTTGIGVAVSMNASSTGAGLQVTAGGGLGLDINQTVQTSGSPTLVEVTGAAHTTLTASAEASDVIFDLARNVQFSTGAITDQRAIKIDPPTYAFVAASTVTRASVMEITGPPAAGANATLDIAAHLALRNTGAGAGFGTVGAFLYNDTTGDAISSAPGVLFEARSDVSTGQNVLGGFNVIGKNAIADSSTSAAYNRLSFWGVSNGTFAGLNELLFFDLDQTGILPGATGMTLGNSVIAWAGGYLESSLNNTDTILTVSKTPGASNAGHGIFLTMGANATGNGINVSADGSGNTIDITHSGAGDAINIDLDSGTAAQAMVIVCSAGIASNVIDITHNQGGAANIIDINRAPAASTAGNMIDINMGANCTGHALNLVQQGSGDVIRGNDGTNDIFRVDDQGRVIADEAGASNVAYGFMRTGTVDAGTGIYSSADGTVNIATNTTEVARFDTNATAGNTRLMIYDVDNVALERVSVGAADSGGSGFKVLRIPN